jgi:hypothetical protein
MKIETVRSFTEMMMICRTTQNKILEDGNINVF